MSKDFKLNSAFKPSGDQPEAIRRLEAGLEDGLAHQTLLGVTGSGKTFTVANVIADLNRPTMVLAPNKTLAAQLYGEMKEFFPDNAVEFLSPITITTSLKPMSQALTPLSKKTPRLTNTSSRCVFPPLKHYWSGVMLSSLPRCRPFTVWAIPIFI